MRPCLFVVLLALIGCGPDSVPASNYTPFKRFEIHGNVLSYDVSYPHLPHRYTTSELTIEVINKDNIDSSFTVSRVYMGKLIEETQRETASNPDGKFTIPEGLTRRSYRLRLICIDSDNSYYNAKTSTSRVYFSDILSN
jgi:hypothetical protein